MDAVAADSRNTLVLEDALRAAEGRAGRRGVEWSRGAESGADFGYRFRAPIRVLRGGQTARCWFKSTLAALIGQIGTFPEVLQPPQSRIDQFHSIKKVRVTKVAKNPKRTQFKVTFKYTNIDKTVQNCKIDFNTKQDALNLGI